MCKYGTKIILIIPVMVFEDLNKLGQIKPIRLHPVPFSWLFLEDHISF